MVVKCPGENVGLEVDCEGSGSTWGDGRLPSR